MAPAHSVLRHSGEPAGDPHARCAACGHVGTVGLVARGDDAPLAVGRYCFRCWPTARRAAQAQWHADVAAHQVAYWAWFDAASGAAAADVRSRRLWMPEDDPTAPAGPGGLSLEGSWRGLLADALYRLGLLRARPPVR